MLYFLILRVGDHNIKIVKRIERIEIIKEVERIEMIGRVEKVIGEIR